MDDSYLRSARAESLLRLSELTRELGDAERLVAGRACVYATGSFGRLEAGKRSDLDLFIVVDKPIDGLDEIRLKYQLITAVENRGLPKFDGGGKYLKVHTIGDFTKKLGSPEDDYENTLTGRLLMLLESKPLLGQNIYTKALREVIAAYFIDYDDNRSQFIPAFLINDIMRMWRTFCVNYEYFRTKGSEKSKIKNLKLKYSRMLTCYSAIIYLLAVFVRDGTVSPDGVETMVRVTPTERVETIGNGEFWAPGAVNKDLKRLAAEALDMYSEFLALVHQDARDVAKEYAEHQKDWRAKSHEFGEKLAKVLDTIAHSKGDPSRLYRFILI